MVTLNEEGKHQYLCEHVFYEREMLKHSFMKLHNTSPGIDWNIAYESFGIHARNLYDFFRNEGNRQTTFRAGDYVKDWQPPSAKLSFNELDVFQFHMSTKRTDRDKINLSKLQELGSWLDDCWQKWFDKLPEQFQKELSPDAVCNVPQNLAVGITAATACTNFQVSKSTYSTAGQLAISNDKLSIYTISK